ncbi:sugar transferase [Candidatus Collierbacteria bacterium]|nr:sugar transferase [Candidatus Collierbacteria bacterium]
MAKRKRDDGIFMTISVYRIGKRALDIAVAIILTFIFLPLWLIIPVLIKLGSSGPALFSQLRVGRNGKIFKILKFRSMVANADDLLWKASTYKELRNKFTKSDWKLENDPRVTGVGWVLRRLSIDEFPQVFNILKGDMSIVGPRAYRPQEIEAQAKKYPYAKKWIEKALMVKPGLTGLWQVSGRNDVPFDKRVQIDAEYASRKSLVEDLWILLKTPKAMLSKW